MSNTIGPLSDEEVQQIVKIVETLQQSKFDFLRLGLGDLKLTVSKGVPPDVSTESDSI